MYYFIGGFYPPILVVIVPLCSAQWIGPWVWYFVRLRYLPTSIAGGLVMLAGTWRAGELVISSVDDGWISVVGVWLFAAAWIGLPLAAYLIIVLGATSAVEHLHEYVRARRAA